MKSWAYAYRGPGRAEAVDPHAACGADGGDIAPFVWVHLDGSENAAQHWLQHHGKLPDAVMHALTAIETRPRCEPIGKGALINLRGIGAEPSANGDPLVSVRMWAEAGRVISVSYRSLDVMPEVRARMEAGHVRDPGDLIAAIGTLITSTLDPLVADLGDAVDACEASLEPGEIFTMRRTIAKARSDAIGYRRFVAPQREALATLALLDADWLEDDDRLHLREAANRFARMSEELEAVRERSALLHEQLSDMRAEQLDTRSLVLSVVALVFLPLTFLTGLLGMNVEGIPYAHTPWAFGAVVAICVLLSLVIGGYFIRARWFR